MMGLDLELQREALRCLRLIQRDVELELFPVSQQVALSIRRLVETARAHGDPEQTDLILGQVSHRRLRMKKIEVSEDDRDEIARSLRTARLSLAALELALSLAGLGSGKADATEKKSFSVERFKNSLKKEV